MRFVPNVSFIGTVFGHSINFVRRNFDSIKRVALSSLDYLNPWNTSRTTNTHHWNFCRLKNIAVPAVGLLALSMIPGVSASDDSTSVLTDKINYFILAFIFALHNGEEYYSFDKMPEGFYRRINKRFDDSEVFLYAVTLLSGEVSALAISNCFYNSNKVLEVFKNLTFFSIAINSVQHMMGSLIYKRVLPGTITATVIVAPFSAYYLTSLFEQEKITSLELLYYIPSSMGFSFVSIYFHLWAGYFIKKLRLTISNSRPQLPF